MTLMRLILSEKSHGFRRPRRILSHVDIDCCVAFFSFRRGLVTTNWSQKVESESGVLIPGHWPGKVLGVHLKYKK